MILDLFFLSWSQRVEQNESWLLITTGQGL